MPVAKTLAKNLRRAMGKKSKNKKLVSALNKAKAKRAVPANQTGISDSKKSEMTMLRKEVRELEARVNKLMTPAKGTKGISDALNKKARKKMTKKRPKKAMKSAKKENYLDTRIKKQRRAVPPTKRRIQNRRRKM